MEVYSDSYLRVRRTGDDTSNSAYIGPDGTAQFSNGNIQFQDTGSALFKGDVVAGSNPSTGVTNNGLMFRARGGVIARSEFGTDNVFAGFVENNASETSFIKANGEAYFGGDVTSDGTIGFNLEPENPDNWTVTEEEYEVEVPKLRPDGPVTADLVDGAPEQEMQTITRTREVKTYTGPTMDVKDTLLKITEALTQLKAAAASAETCEELRNAIDTALADV